MRPLSMLLLALSLIACDGDTTSGPGAADAGADAPPPTDAGRDAPPPYDGPVGTGRFCDLPGSYRTSKDGITLVPGGTNAVDLSFLRLPAGFCAHYFGRVGNPRQLRFAPGGELFVASPTKNTTSNGAAGQNAILVLPDDDKGGYADEPIPFLTKLPATQGLLFTATHLYYQDDTRIRRVPYKAGDRAPSGASQQVTEITYFSSLLHWPKVLDQADDGTIYVTNGGDQGDICEPSHLMRGGILRINSDGTTTNIAKGFRNPIGIRCSRGHNLCYAIELSRDFSAGMGGREKLVPVRKGDDWGFPCCATKDLPYPDITNPVPDCSTVAAESDEFLIGSTPFDLDFEKGKWPEPWKGRVYVPLHGTNGNWEGARLVGIATDPTTGQPLHGSNVNGESTGAMADFATGYENKLHGRPTEVAFSPDGRLFLSNDVNGDIVWIAPLELE